MLEPLSQVIADLRELGVTLDGMGDGWFVRRPEDDPPTRFLYLADGDLNRYLESMTDADVDGAFGPDVTPDDARYRLTILHLEEALEAGDGIRYIVLEGGQIRSFTDATSVPKLPPGDYEWQASAR